MAPPEQEIIQRVLSDVHWALPGSVGLEPVQARCIKEKRATFAAVPGAEAWRPSPRPHHAHGPGIENLYLAGDWCDTGWPATMEGAVRSGYLAAEAVLQRLGQSDRLLIPDLRHSWLARRLFKP